MNKNTHCLDGITCDAEKCAYNENRSCHASSIKVDGPYADDSHRTECSTFINKSETE